MKKALIIWLVILLASSSFAQDACMGEDKLVTIEPLGYIIKEPQIYMRGSRYDGLYCYGRFKLRCNSQYVQVLLGGIPANISGEIEYFHEEKKAHKYLLPFSHKNHENTITLSETYLRPKPFNYWLFLTFYRYY